MSQSSAGDPVLNRFRQALDEIYGAQIERVVLFGSSSNSKFSF